ncbi:MAG: hypothetical protein LBE23_07615, partial [Vagococcus sp.]|nr:hypothetical protein [Vagococcus sp.]
DKFRFIDNTLDERAKYKINNKKKYIVEDNGHEIIIYSRGVKKTLDKSDLIKIQSIYKLPEIIQSSIYLDSEINNKTTNKEVVKFEYYANKIEIEDKHYLVKMTVAVAQDKNKTEYRFYEHSLSEFYRLEIDSNTGGYRLTKPALPMLPSTILAGPKRSSLAIQEPSSYSSWDRVTNPGILEMLSSIPDKKFRELCQAKFLYTYKEVLTQHIERDTERNRNLIQNHEPLKKTILEKMSSDPDNAVTHFRGFIELIHANIDNESFKITDAEYSKLYDIIHSNKKLQDDNLVKLINDPSLVGSKKTKYDDKIEIISGMITGDGDWIDAWREKSEIFGSGKTDSSKTDLPPINIPIQKTVSPKEIKHEFSNKEIKDAWYKVGSFIGNMFLPSESRIRNINEDIYNELSRQYLQFIITLGQRNQIIAPFVRAVLGISKSKVDKKELRLAKKNKDTEKINEIKNKPFNDKLTIMELETALFTSDYKTAHRICKELGIFEEYKLIRKLLDRIYKEITEEAGFKVGYTFEYWPRVLKNPLDLASDLIKEWGLDIHEELLKKAVIDRMAKTGDILTIEEVEHILNTEIKSRKLCRIGNYKTRKKYNRSYYFDFLTSLSKYIYRATKRNHDRMFFNRFIPNMSDDKSIGWAIEKYLDHHGEKGVQRADLIDLIDVHFNDYKKPGWIQFITDMTHICVLNSPFQSIRQLQENALAYHGAFRKFYPMLLKFIRGKQLFKMEDVGLSRVYNMYELLSDKILGKFKSKMFYLTGQAISDVISKDTTMNGYFEKYHDLIMKNKLPKDIEDTWKRRYRGDYKQLIEDIKNKNKESKLVLEFLLLSIIETQPIFKGGTPYFSQRYPLYSLFTTLRTYTLKKIDQHIRKVKNEYKAGKMSESKYGWLIFGCNLLIYYITCVISSSVKWQCVMSFARLTRWDPWNMIFQGHLENVGLSRYHFHQFRRNGFLTGTRRLFSPPVFNLIENLIRDGDALINEIILQGDIKPTRDFLSIQKIPYIGRPFFWWFGQGHEWVMDDIRRFERRRNSGRYFYNPLRDDWADPLNTVVIESRQPHMRLRKWMDDKMR